MSYSLKRENIDRVANYLDVLVDSQAEQVVFDCENSTRFAFKLREAFFAAQHYPEYSHYHSLKEEYKILAGIRRVVCKRVLLGGQQFRVAAVGVGKVQLAEITTLTGIIGAALRFKSADELWFPNANLVDEQKRKVYNWTASQDWQFIDHGDAGMTLTKKEVEEDILWKPRG